MFYLFFFFNDTATTEIYTLSLHDALPIYDPAISRPVPPVAGAMAAGHRGDPAAGMDPASASAGGGDHTRHRGLGQDRAHHRDRRVNGVPQRSRHPGRAPRGQRGIALLVAILLVALGTIIAAAVAYENALSARRGTATYAFDQALLIAQGAEALDRKSVV